MRTKTRRRRGRAVRGIAQMDGDGQTDGQTDSELLLGRLHKATAPEPRDVVYSRRQRASLCMRGRAVASRSPVRQSADFEIHTD